MKIENSIKLFVISILFIGCKQATNHTSNEVAETVTNIPSTYAEISIAEGGQWEGREYKDRKSFKNVNTLSVPSQHTDHSYFIRYEGPGWESEMVGYRLYLDWRNAIDVFGKKISNRVLPEVGQDGFDSYHEISDWGMDVLKVGKSLGLGSYGKLVNDSVYHFQVLDSTSISVVNSSKFSSVKINYYGWGVEESKTDLTSELSIEPNSRLTKVTLSDFTTAEGMVTGIVKLPDTELLKGNSTSKWNYLATYGKQSLVPDNLGMVIFYRNADVDEVLDGTYDHLVQFDTDLKRIEYYFAATWEQEPGGIKTKDEFESYIQKISQELK